jgi:hypothetical protein
MKFIHCSLAFCVTTAAASAGDAKSPVTAGTGGDWQFSLSVGAAYSQAGTLGFSGGSLSGGFGIPSFVGNDSLTVPPIKLPGEIGNRTYADGYVRRDGSTGIDGLTTNWGYQNASQAGSDEIAFHATGYQSIRSDLAGLAVPSSGESDQQGFAPVLQIDARYGHSWQGWKPGVSATLSWMPLRMDRSWSDFSLSQQRNDFRLDYTDRYNLGGVGAFLPGAPYSGTAGSPGFVLENIPDSRDVVVVPIGSESALVTNSVTTHFRADHTSFSFGPTLEREIDENWSLQAGAGISLHWLHWSASQGESLTVTGNSGTARVADWSDSSSGDRLLPGIYLQIGSEWKPDHRAWSIRSFLRADVGSSTSFRVGPSKYTYDLDGYTAAVLLVLPL